MFNKASSRIVHNYHNYQFTWLNKEQNKCPCVNVSGGENLLLANQYFVFL